MKKFGIGKYVDSYTNKYESSYITSYNWSQICDHKQSPIFKISGMDIYAGRQGELYPIPTEGLMLALAYEPKQEIINKSRISIRKNMFDYIYINWEDQSAPPFDIHFLKELVNKAKNAGYKSLHIGCVGGHGRTGTLLAGLAIIEKLTNNPVEFIRKNYCERAIESEKQKAWIVKSMEDIK